MSDGPERTQKYTLSQSCDWCGDAPAHSFVIEKRGTKEKRLGIEVTACAQCARRLQLAPD